LQCVLAAKILTVDFFVCTLAVKKKFRAGFDMSDQTIPLSVSPHAANQKSNNTHLGMVEIAFVCMARTPYLRCELQQGGISILPPLHT
jgi:hypothetical protein